MSRLVLPPCLLFVLMCGMTAHGQRHKVIPSPPPPADSRIAPAPAETPQTKRFDGFQAEREARELSDLAKSIPLDVEHVNQGLMPKDIVQKLKRIEKLSKHLRYEVSGQ